MRNLWYAKRARASHEPISKKLLKIKQPRSVDHLGASWPQWGMGTTDPLAHRSHYSRRLERVSVTLVTARKEESPERFSFSRGLDKGYSLSRY